METAVAFDQSMNDAFATQVQEIRKTYSDALSIADLNVTNMTIFYQTSATFDIDAFTEDTLSEIEMSLMFAGHTISDATLSGIGTKPHCRFRNARILSFRDHIDGGKKCLLLFRNGGIQVKGLRSAVRGANICLAVLNALSSGEDILDMDVHLINSKTSLQGFHINLDQVHQILVEDNRAATLDRESHSAVNLAINYKNEKKITALIFRKGSILITGSNNATQLVSAFAYVSDFFSKATHVLCTAPVAPVSDGPKKRGRKRKIVTEEIYGNLDI
jgi:TATA-box binding protein (TBP) (component of TFIID and TFIIIB)